METADKISAVTIDSLGLVRYPDPRLAEVCTPVENVDGTLVAVIERMAEIMFAARGIGLAAPQVGITARFFIASPAFEPDELEVYINPRIVSREGAVDGEEGCLSFPDVYADIRRAERVAVEAVDLDGRPFSRMVEDLGARVVQHEYDHIEGITFVEKMGSIAKLSNRKTLRQLERDFAG